MHQQRISRISRELSEIAANPPHGISVSARDENISILDAQIIGPESTPYKNGLFRLEIQISEKYPFAPPSIRFLTKIYHPNIDDSGRICLDLIKMPPKGSWRPTIGLEGLFIAIRMLMESPNPDDPLMADIADEFKNKNEAYLENARKYTEKYAK